MGNVLEFISLVQLDAMITKQKVECSLITSVHWMLSLVAFITNQ